FALPPPPPASSLERAPPNAQAMLAALDHASVRMARIVADARPARQPGRARSEVSGFGRRAPPVVRLAIAEMRARADQLGRIEIVQARDVDRNVLPFVPLRLVHPGERGDAAVLTETAWATLGRAGVGAKLVGAAQQTKTVRRGRDRPPAPLPAEAAAALAGHALGEVDVRFEADAAAV